MSDFLKNVRKEHKWKIQGLAKYVLDKPTKEERRKFLDKFQELHGKKMRSELEVAIMEKHRALRSAPTDQPR